MVWLNRLLVWFTVIALFLIVATPLWVAIEFGNLTPLIQHMDNSYVDGQRTPGSFNGTLFQLPAVLTFAVLVSLTYASGQLCSMLLRSGIIAAFLGVILAAVFVAWSIGMSVLGVNWLISIAPLPIILLWVTWLRRRTGSPSARAGGRGRAWVCRWPCHCWPSARQRCRSGCSRSRGLPRAFRPSSTSIK